MSLAAATVALAAVLSLLAAADALGSASTIAISNNTVCAILAGASPRAVQCAVPGAAVPTVSLANASFNSLSGGRDFLCGLRPDTSAAENLFCWAPTAPATTRKRLYDGPNTLAGVSVGANHVAANVNVNGSGSSPGVEFWRGVGGGFPQFVSGEYRSLTSGSGFSCGVDSNSTVRCWGRAGAAIEASFGNVSMSSIVAGVDRVCGLRADGVLTCTAADSQRLDVPFHDSASAFEFSGVAVGANHSCAIRQSNRTVVCWHGDARYAPAGDTSFVLIVAGANLACGLTTGNYSVVCWGPNATNPAPTTLPLLKALPGLCIPSQSSCECGVFPDSESLCSGSVICSACDSKAPILSSPPSPSSPPEPHKTSKLWLAYAIVGSVGALAGVCAIIYCLWRACRQNRVHNSVQPTIAAAADNVAQSQSQSQSQSPPHQQSIPRTRSGVFRRQTSRPIHRQRSGTSKSANISSFKTESFAFAELAAATKNFALENKIGAGSYGTVYRGKLADGREVAIKRSETSPKAKKLQEKETAFQSELASLSRIHHKHLVGLVGFCDEREERLLVYEYMKNGSLYDHLHGGGGAMASWKMRIKVLLDAARGLEYLHNYAVPPIIHRDIKSSNILLDGSWVARVSDFGLSLERGAWGGEEEPVAARAVGTVGYMDPEYYGMQQLTTKSDVYGMGVVMLEVLTGRRAIFREEEQPRSVVDYAVPGIAAGEVGRVLDPTVAAPEAGGEAEAVELVAYTAVRCVSLEGRERPAMSDVVGNLENALAICDDNRGTLSSNSVQSVD